MWGNLAVCFSKSQEEYNIDFEGHSCVGSRLRLLHIREIFISTFSYLGLKNIFSIFDINKFVNIIAKGCIDFTFNPKGFDQFVSPIEDTC